MTDDHRFAVQMYLERVEAQGGTELAAPLQMTTHLLSGTDPRRDRVLLLLTDGQVGNKDQLLHILRDQVQGFRIFTVGIDRAVNEGFLRRLAEWGRGAYTLVESAERLDAALAEVHRHIGTPALTNVRLVGTGLNLQPAAQVPARGPDLFVGSHLALWLPYADATADPAITVTATQPDGSPWSQTLPVQYSEAPALFAAWARGRVRALEDALAAGQGRAALERELIDTSLRYRVLCRFTAFVAIDRSTIVNPGGHAPTIPQAVEPTQAQPEQKKKRLAH
jgi:Ca-activated chloride channel family protein